MTLRVIRNADRIVTMDGPDLEHTDVLIRDGCVAELGPGLSAPGAEILDASGCVITPGLVNTHHHLFQTLTRAVPGGQDALLFGWLTTLYPIWSRMTPGDIALSARLGLAELALSGCTTSSDHLYLFPNGARLDDTIEAAQKVGLRFHATRGSMSIGESAGGLPPDNLVEREEDILNDCMRVIDAFHDPAPGAMTRIGLAPCSPFSVSRELMRDSAILARGKGVGLHTHLAENDEDIAYSLENFGCRPGQYAEDLGWTGEDVWHAHCVKLGRVRDRPIRADWNGGRPLSLLELPSRLGDCAGPADARRGRDGGPRCRWLGLERPGEPDRRGAAGDAAATGGERRRRNERARGVGACNHWRCEGAWPKRYRQARTGLPGRHRHLGRLGAGQCGQLGSRRTASCWSGAGPRPYRRKAVKSSLKAG